MATYVILMNFTEQGVKTVKESPARVNAMFRSVEAAGGKITAMYATMGQYDLVAIAEGPSDQVTLLQLLGLGMAGNVRTTTLKAFSMEEFAALLQQLP